MSHPARLTKKPSAITGSHLSTMHHNDGESHNVCLAHVQVTLCLTSTLSDEKKKKKESCEKMCVEKKTPLQVYCFATNESSSYRCNLITAPTESNYWSSCDTFTLSLQRSLYKLLPAQLLFPVPVTTVSKKQLGGTTFNWWANMADNQGWKPNYSLREPSKQTPAQSRYIHMATAAPAGSSFKLR